MERDDYIRTLVDFLELMPPTVLVERIHRRRRRPII